MQLRLFQHGDRRQGSQGSVTLYYNSRQGHQVAYVVSVKRLGDRKTACLAQKFLYSKRVAALLATASSPHT